MNAVMEAKVLDIGVDGDTIVCFIFCKIICYFFKGFYADDGYDERRDRFFFKKIF